jgi:hypothetical protein
MPEPSFAWGLRGRASYSGRYNPFPWGNPNPDAAGYWKEQESYWNRSQTYWPKSESDLNEERRRNFAYFRQPESFADHYPITPIQTDPAPTANIFPSLHTALWSESIPSVILWPAIQAQNTSWNPAQFASYQMSRAPAEPSIQDRLTQTEEKLLRLHDINALGSIDVDYFSEELLAIKKNHAAMLSINGHLSPREQKQLSAQLSSLEKELDFRTTSSFYK